MEKSTSKAKSQGSSKLNRKFLLLVAGFVLFAGIVLGGIFYWSYSGAPERNIRVGDELVAEAKAAETAGDANGAYKKFQEAISRYGRAVNKKPNNLEYSQKMLDAIVLMTPKTTGDAFELYQRKESLLQKRTRSAPTDGKQWMHYLDSLDERATLFEAAEMWQRIVETCDDAIGKVNPSDPNLAAIRSLRVVAELNRDEVLTVEERVAAEASAAEHTKEFPTNGEVWSSWLRSIAIDSHRLATANRLADSKARNEEFTRVLALARAALPKDSWIDIAELQHLQSLRQLRDPMATPQAINALLDPFLWERGDRNATALGLAKDLDGKALAKMASVVGASQDPDARARMILVLQNYCARSKHPLVELNAIGKLQQAINDNGAARETYERMLAMPSPKVSMLAAYADEIRANAIEEIFALDFGQWEEAKSKDARAAALAAATATRERLAKIVEGRTDQLALTRSDAKLAFARGDFLGAITKLEEVFAQQKRVQAELYLLSVYSLSERGEQGAALIKINRAIEEYPGISQFYLIRARIEAKLGRLSDAKRSINSLLARDPENAEGLKILAELKSIPTEGSVDLNDPGVNIMGDAELLANEGAVEEAIAMIREGLVHHPKDIRLKRTLCQWLLFLGKTKEAQDLLAQYLAESPNDSALKQLNLVATISSRVARIEALAAEPNADGSPRSPEDKALSLALGLVTLRESIKSRIASLPPSEQASLTAELNEVSTAAKAAVEKAVQLVPGDPALIERLYLDAVAEGKLDQVDQLIALAEQHCKDKTIALLLRGRVALDRNDPDKAVEFFERATAVVGAPAAAHRMLGFAREKVGDVDGARAAYQLSYERRPNDIQTVQLYAALLGRAGKVVEARDVLRNAMLAMPESALIRNAYLEIESLYGNRAESLLQRRRLYSVRPADVDNARQFMRLLIEIAPTREYLVDDAGAQLIPPKEWDALGKERQDLAIAEVVKAALVEARSVYEKLLKLNPEDRLTIRTFASSMQRSGRGAEAQEVLLARAQAATGPDAWKAWLDLGELQLQANRTSEAMTNLDRAVELDATESSDASRIIASIWADRHQPARALQVLTAAYSKHPTAGLARTVTALRLETRDFVGAKAMSAELAKLSGGTRTFSDRLLDADIATAELEESFKTAPEADIKRITLEFSTALDDAIRMNPSSALPYVVRATSLQRRFQRSGDPELLRLAKADATRAIELQGDYWPGVRLLASIQLDEGDIGGATQTIRHFVAQNPRSADARRALVAYHLTAGDYTGGVRVAQEILDLEPNNPVWWYALADAHIAASKRLDAATDYERIFRITADSNVLVQAILLRVMNDPPDFPGILNAFKLAPQLVTQVPFIQMIGAAAIAATATTDVQRNQGTAQLRDMYGLMVKSSPVELTDPWMTAVAGIFPKEKLVEFEKFALDASANSPSSSLCRAMAQRFIEVGDVGSAKAKEYSAKALQLATTDAEKFDAYRVIGGAEYKAGRFTEAAAAFESAIGIRRDDVAALNNLAYLEARYLNKVSQAVERARGAFGLNPTNPDLMDTLGYALLKANDLPEAISLLRRSSRAQPTAMSFAHLAEAFAVAGRRTEAAEALLRAKALQPDAEEQSHIDEVTKMLDAPSGG